MNTQSRIIGGGRFAINTESMTFDRVDAMAAELRVKSLQDDVMEALVAVTGCPAK